MSTPLTKTPGWALVFLAALSLPRATAQPPTRCPWKRPKSSLWKTPLRCSTPCWTALKRTGTSKRRSSWVCLRSTWLRTTAKDIDIPTHVAAGDVFGFPDYPTAFLGGVAQETGGAVERPSRGSECPSPSSSVRPIRPTSASRRACSWCSAARILSPSCFRSFVEARDRAIDRTADEVMQQVAEAYHWRLARRRDWRWQKRPWPCWWKAKPSEALQQAGWRMR